MYSFFATENRLESILMGLKILIFGLGSLWLVLLYADAPPEPEPKTDKAATEAQLAHLNEKIAHLQTRMHTTRSRYGRLQRLLQRSEVDISEFTRQIKRLKRQSAQQQQRLDNLAVELAHYQQALTIQQQQLAQQLRMAYMTGRQNYLKLWLNQQDPFSIGRLLTYHDYFNRARTQHLIELKTVQQQLTQVQQQIAQEQAELEALLAEQIQEKQLLEQSQQQRQAVLVELEQTLSSQTEELSTLQTDKQQLQAFLQDLDNALAALSPLGGAYPAFADLKGALPYPVAGQIKKRFGHKRIDRLKWEGLLITAPAGKPVTAIAAGRVVFAEWFRNLGFLAIIEHGQGYMSLYAHQQNLSVQTGDWVESGAVLGAVGNSGGQPATALYFEIRYQGVPVNPAPWLRRG